MLNAKTPLSAGIPKNPKKKKKKKEEREHDTLSLSVGRDPRSCVFCMIEKQSENQPRILSMSWGVGLCSPTRLL
jgi:hypothetical protein